MSDALVLFLPTSTAGWRWLRIGNAAVRDRGEGLPEVAAETELPPPTVIAPAEDVTLHWSRLPDASRAQAAAAARLLIAEASAAPVAGLHVAVGREGDADERPIAVVADGTMRSWLTALAERGIDPAALIPAPFLLPRPDQGFVVADLGGERIVRGTASAFADDPLLTPIVTDGSEPAAIGEALLDEAIVAAIADPPLDLRQGAFARRRKLTLDWALLRRLAWLSAAILAVTLLIALVRIYRYEVAAAALEQRADTLARGALARGEAVNDADRQLDARLAGLRGAGQGFTATSAALFDAVSGVAGTEVTSLAFDADGTLRAGIGATNEGQIAQLRDGLIARGFVVTPSTFTASGGRLTGDLTVKAP